MKRIVLIVVLAVALVGCESPQTTSKLESQAAQLESQAAKIEALEAKIEEQAAQYGRVNTEFVTELRETLVTVLANQKDVSRELDDVHLKTTCLNIFEYVELFREDLEGLSKAVKAGEKYDPIFTRGSYKISDDMIQTCIDLLGEEINDKSDGHRLVNKHLSEERAKGHFGIPWSARWWKD
tara:strand:- start:674 stop:1216 length:543 start_codon:yes stop_codon:yes gene_type:complete